MALTPKEKRQIKKIYYKGGLDNILVSYEGGEKLNALSDDEVRIRIADYKARLVAELDNATSSIQSTIDDLDN